MTDDVGAAVAVARVKTNAEKEDIAVQLMLEQNIKPKKAQYSDFIEEFDILVRQ